MSDMRHHEASAIEARSQPARSSPGRVRRWFSVALVVVGSTLACAQAGAAPASDEVLLPVGSDAAGVATRSSPQFLEAPERQRLRRELRAYREWRQQQRLEWMAQHSAASLAVDAGVGNLGEEARPAEGPRAGRESPSRLTETERAELRQMLRERRAARRERALGEERSARAD